MKPHGGALSGFAGNFKPPAQFFNARPHVVHSVHFLGPGAQRQTTPIIGNDEVQFPRPGLNTQADLGGSGVAHNVMERLLESQK